MKIIVNTLCYAICIYLMIGFNVNYLQAKQLALCLDNVQKITNNVSNTFDWIANSNSIKNVEQEITGKWFLYYDLKSKNCILTPSGGGGEKATLFFTKDFGLTNVTLLKIKHIFTSIFLGLGGYAYFLVYDSDGKSLLYKSELFFVDDYIEKPLSTNPQFNATVVYDVNIDVGDSFYVAVQSMSLDGSGPLGFPMSCRHSTLIKPNSYIRYNKDGNWEKLISLNNNKELATSIYVTGDTTPVQLVVKVNDSIHPTLSIENVLINLVAMDNNKTITCVTDNEGICSFENFPQDVYQIDIIKKNYLPIHDELDIAGYQEIEYELQPMIGDNCLSMNNSLQLCADKIEYVNSDLNTIKASGNVNINNLIHFDGNLEFNKKSLLLNGNTSVNIKDIEPFEKITLFKGEFQFSIQQAMIDLANDIITDSIPISLPLNIKAIEILSDGIRIEGELKFPEIMGHLDVEINALQITQSKGIDLEGEIVVNNVKLHKTISLETFILKFNTDEKTFEGEAILKAKIFDIEANALIKQSKLESVGVYVESMNPIPVGSTGFSISGGGGTLGGISTPPMKLSLLVSLVPTIQGSFEIVKLTHLELEYTFGKQLKGTGSFELFSKDIAAASIIITKSNISFEADMELMEILKGHADASLSKTLDNSILFEGNLNASLIVPKKSGFPFDLIECFIKLPYTFAKTDNHIRNTKITGNAYISNYFDLKYLLEWDSEKNDFDNEYAINFTRWTDRLFNRNLVKSKNNNSLDNRFEGHSLIISKNHLNSNLKIKSQKIQQHFSLDYTVPIAIIRIEGQKNIPESKLIIPDGKIVDSNNVDNFKDIELVQNTVEKKKFYILTSPQSGDWILELPKNDVYYIDVYVSNAPPAIKIIDIKQKNHIIDVSWVNSDPDNEATVNLYYDYDNNGANGVSIVSNIPENDLINKYSWDTSNIEAGTYYIYASINDTINPPEIYYWHEPLTLIPEEAPAKPTMLDYTTTNNSIVLSWIKSPDENIVNYKIYYDRLNTLDYNSPSFLISNSTSFEIKKTIINSFLEPGKQYLFSVTAIDNNNNESMLSNIIELKYINNEQYNPPFIINHSFNQIAFPDRLYVQQIQSLDYDDHEISFEFKKKPENMQIDQSGMISWQPDSDQVGIHSIHLIAHDTEGLTDSVQYQINVLDEKSTQSHIHFDKSLYKGYQETGLIILNNLTINKYANIIETTSLKLCSDSQPGCISLIAHETMGSSGKFVACFNFSYKNESNKDSSLFVEKESKLWIEYQDEFTGNIVQAFSSFIDSRMPDDIINVPDDYPTIQLAIDSAIDGNTIVVKDGTYTENIIINKEITLKSENGYTTTNIVGIDTNTKIISINTDYVTIDGFSIYALESKSNYNGILLNHSNHCILTNNKVTEIITGIFLSNSKYNRIYNNIANYCGSAGIEIFRSSFNIIDSNICYYNFNGIDIECSYNMIINNDCSFNSYRGINTFYSGNHTYYENGSIYYSCIVNNSCNSNGFDGIYSYGDSLIFGNSLKFNKECGVIYSKNNVLYLNEFFNNQDGHCAKLFSKNKTFSTTEFLYEYKGSVFKSFVGNKYDDHIALDSNFDGIAENIYDFQYIENTDKYPISSSPEHYELNARWLSNDNRLVANDMTKMPGIVSINNSSQIWIAEKSDTSKNYIGPDTWTGQLSFAKKLQKDQILFIEIGYSLDGNSFHQGGPESSIQGNDQKSIYSFQTQTGALSIPENGHLALQVTNKTKEEFPGLLTGGAWSYLVEPIQPGRRPIIHNISNKINSSQSNEVQFIVINGSAFGEETGQVLFGDIEPLSYSVWSNNKILCSLPNVSNSFIDVHVKTNAGLSGKIENAFIDFDRTIIVGKNEDFANIQKAINIAQEGYTIIVKDGIYYENIVINKPLTVMSENGYSACFIKPFEEDKNVIYIYDHVTFKGFTILSNDEPGINISGIKILGSNNYIVSNRPGHDTTNNNNYGITVLKPFNQIAHNICVGNLDYGIVIEDSNNLICNNICYSNKNGICIYSDTNMIIENICKQNQNGIILYGIENMINKNILFDNEISGISCSKFCEIDDCNPNIIFMNSFNQSKALSIFSSEYNSVSYDYNLANIWYLPVQMLFQYNENLFKGYLGNYYDDHYLYDSDQNGITDFIYDFPFFEDSDKAPLAIHPEEYTINAWFLNKDNMLYHNNMISIPETISIDESYTWIATEAARGEDIINSNNDVWTGQIYCNSKIENKALKIEVGYLQDDELIFDSEINVRIINNDMYRKEFQTDSKEFILKKDSYLALRISVNKDIYTHPLIISIGGAFSFISPPGNKKMKILNIQPLLFDSTGETIVTIDGSGFGFQQNQLSVLFNGSEALGYSSWTNNQIICYAPPHKPEQINIQIIDDSEKSLLSYTGNIFFYDGTIYVGKKDQMFSTIQAAINYAKDYDKIVVKDGIYKENLFIYKPLTIKSENGYTSTIIESISSDDHVVNILDNFVTFDGFTVYESKAGKAGIYLSKGTGNCIISNNRFGIDELHQNMWGIYLEDSVKNHLIDNSCIYNKSSGIFLNNNSHFNLINLNTCMKNSAYGIKISSDYNTLSNNICKYNKRSGFIIMDSDDEFSEYNTVSNNISEHNTSSYWNYSQNGFNLSVNNSLFIGNKSNNNKEDDFYLYKGSINNTFILNTLEKGSIKFRDKNDVAKNSFYSPTEMSYSYLGHSFKKPLGNYFGDKEDNFYLDENSDGIIDNKNSPTDNFLLANTTMNYQLSTLFLSSDNRINRNNLSKQQGSILLKKDNPAIWFYDQEENTSTKYPGHDCWTGQIVLITPLKQGDSLYIEIGVSTNNMEFISKGLKAEIKGDGYNNFYTFQTNMQEFTVDLSQFLAIRIQNNNSEEYEILSGGAFSYINEPSDNLSQIQMSNILPQTGLLEGGNNVIINGVGFGSEKGTVIFGDKEALSYSKWSMYEIQCEAPSNTEGFVNVKVIAANSLQGEIKNGYLYFKKGITVGNNQMFNTIQSAIDFAKENDTIFVQSGAYTENIIISKPLTIKSEKGYSSTIVIGNNKENDENDENDKNDKNAGFLIQSNNVVIDGFTIYNADYGICVSSEKSSCIISNNQCGVDNLHRNNEYGIYLSELTHNNIVSNNICVSNNIGIYLEITRKNIIYENKCFNNNTGIKMFGVGFFGYPSIYNTIWGNICNYNKYKGIIVSGSKRNIVSNNICEMNEKFGFLLDWMSDDNHMYLNTLKNNKEKNISQVNYPINEWKSPIMINYSYKGNSCSKNFVGNYYSDHLTDNQNNNGISTLPYYLPDFEGIDNYALISESEDFVPNIWWLSGDNKIHQNIGQVANDVIIEPNGTYEWISDFPYTFTGNNALTGQITFYETPKIDHTFSLELGTTDNDSNFITSGSKMTLSCDGVSKSIVFQLYPIDINKFRDNYIAVRINNMNDNKYNILSGAFSYISPPCQKTLQPNISHYEIIEDNNKRYLYVFGNDFGIKKGTISIGNSNVISYVEWNPMKIVCEISNSVPESANIVLITSDNIGTIHYYTASGILYVGQNHYFNKIQDAIENACENDIILVEPGSYTENIYIDKPVTIKSNQGSYSTTVIAKNNSKHVFIVLSDSVNIDGFTVYGATGPDCAGILISRQSKNCKIINNIFGYNSEYQNNYGIILYGKTNLNKISYNIFNFNSYGIGLYDSPSNSIYCNSFYKGSKRNIISENSTNNWSSPEEIVYIYNGSYHVGFMGNYYSDNAEKDTDNNGIIDTAYNLPGSEPDDEHSLVEDFNNYKFLHETNDNKDIQFLLLSIPESAIERVNTQTIQCKIALNKPVSNNLFVSLISSDLSEVIVPSSITITKNNMFANFDATIVDDNDFDGTQQVSITASAYGFTSISAQIKIFDNESQNHEPLINEQVFVINENSPENYIVGTVLATDVDNDILSFYIQPDCDCPFDIDNNTGELYVNNVAQIDYEKITFYHITIQVSDGKSFSSSRITINIDNLNDNKPLITDQTFTVNTHLENSFEFAIIQAEDADNDSLIFSILEGNSDNIFSINSQNGKLIINDNSKLEKDYIYKLTVEATDGLYKENAKITIMAISDNIITQPRLVSPNNGEKQTSISPLFMIDYSSEPYEILHNRTQWQISTEETFSISSLVFDIISETALKSYLLSPFILDENKTYFWRTRFYDDNSQISNWSEINSFTTKISYSDLNINGIPDEQEIFDETIDLDNDKIADLNQSNMKCLQSVVDQTIFSIKTDSDESSIMSSRTIQPKSLTIVNNQVNNNPDVILYLKIKSQLGNIVIIDVYATQPIPTNTIWFQYNLQDEWVDYSEYTTFNSDRKQIRFTLKDGAFGDIDNLQNGIIVFPSGYSFINYSEKDSSSSQKDTDDDGNCFMKTISY